MIDMTDVRIDEDDDEDRWVKSDNSFILPHSRWRNGR